MYQLMIVVMAIALAALAVAGGASYLSSDIGVRSLVVQRSTSGITVISSAMTAYATANGGALPRSSPSDSDVWVEELAPYLPNGVLPQAGEMDWSFVATGSEKRICLTSLQPSEATLTGMRSAAETNPALTLSAECSGASAAPTAEQASLSIAVRR